jgi:hypothetical protein
MAWQLQTGLDSAAAADWQPALPHSLRPRLTAMAPSLADVVRSAGGWLCDQAMAGWDVTVLTADRADTRPARILGARACDLETVLASPLQGRCLQAIAVQADLYDADPRVCRMVRAVLGTALGEVRVWGEGWPGDLLRPARPVRHRLSAAAWAFKAQALAAAGLAADCRAATEVFAQAKVRRSHLVAVR